MHQHDGAVVRGVASQEEGFGFKAKPSWSFLLPEAAVFFLFCFHQRDLKIHPMLTTVSKHIINKKKISSTDIKDWFMCIVHP